MCAKAVHIIRRARAMLTHPTPSKILGDLERKHIVRWIVGGKAGFAFHEKDYIAERFPDEAIEDYANQWAKQVGHREKMAELICSKSSIEQIVAFSFLNDSYKQKMKEKAVLEDPTPKKAFFWARAFPEDRQQMRRYVQGGAWAVRWADQIGDAEEMKDRIDVSFHERMFEREVEGKDVSLGIDR